MNRELGEHILATIAAPIPMTATEVVSVLNRLVVLFDFSPYADTALGYAMDLAIRHNAEIILVHTQKASDPSTAAISDGVAARKGTADLRESLEQQADWSRGLGIETRCLLETGMPAEILPRIVADLKPDILFFAACGNDRSDRRALGSTAESLLRTLPCPAVIIGPKAVKQEADPGQAERMICPIDFPGPVNHRLKAIAGLAKALRTKVELVHAVEVCPERSSAFSAKNVLFDFSCLVGRLLEEGVQAQSALLFGAPERVITEYARGMNADFIMFDLYHEGPLSRCSDNNLFAAILRNTPCAVFTSPNSDGADLRELPTDVLCKIGCEVHPGFNTAGVHFPRTQPQLMRT
jgi:nucleotide-binding universal stress UspA family protein